MKVHLKDVRLSFPDLWVPTAINDGRPKYGADFLLVEGSSVLVEKEDGSKVKTTMEKVLSAVAKQQWKDKGEAILGKLEESKKCYRDGDNKTQSDGATVFEGYEGQMFVTAKNASRPTVVDQGRSPLSEADGKPYSGCYVNAIIDVYAMPSGEKRGLFASLKGVQFVKDGDAFAGGTAADADEFDDLGDGEFAEEGEDDDLFE